MTDDKNWYKAEQSGKEGFVPKNYIQMKPHRQALRVDEHEKVRQMYTDVEETEGLGGKKKIGEIVWQENGRFYARDVKVVQTHLTSETLKSSSVKTGRTKVDDLI